MNLRASLLAQMKTLSDSKRAAQQQAYMKSQMPFWGITAPSLRKLCKDTFAEHPIHSKGQWLDEVKEIWDLAERREEKHAALELLSLNRYRKAWLGKSDLALLKYLIKSGAWWDFVDPLATNHVGYLLGQHTPDISKQMYRWATEHDVWVRRSAILSQLKFKLDTDENLLTHAIVGSINDDNFFARKSIGWALREYSKTKPDFVISFVESHADELSGLSKREAYKVMLKQGLVDSVP